MVARLKKELSEATREKDALSEDLKTLQAHEYTHTYNMHPSSSSSQETPGASRPGCVAVPENVQRVQRHDVQVPGAHGGGVALQAGPDPEVDFRCQCGCGRGGMLFCVCLYVVLCLSQVPPCMLFCVWRYVVLWQYVALCLSQVPPCMSEVPPYLAIAMVFIFPPKKFT